MHKHTKETYIINASQLLNMSALAFAVPLLIGLEQYGKFASLFALPGFFQGLMESYLMLSFSAGEGTKKNNGTYIGLGLLMLTSIISIFIFPLREAVFSTILTMGLFLRSYVAASVYSNPTIRLVKTNLIIEGIVLISYGCTFLVSVLLDVRNYVTPIMMVIISSLACMAYLSAIKYYAKAPTIAQKQFINPKINMRLFFGKFYEDTYITLAPLFISLIFGSVVAGEFRVIVSVIKGLSKAFPLRYEIIVRSIKVGDFNYGYLKVISITFSVIGIGVFIAVKAFGNLFHTFNTDTANILCASGAVVTLLNIGPALCLIEGRFLILTITSMAICIGVGITTNLQSFAISYIVTSFILLFFSLRKMKQFSLAYSESHQKETESVAVI